MIFSYFKFFIPSSQVYKVQGGTFWHFFSRIILCFLYKIDPDYGMSSRRSCIHIGTGNSSVYGTLGWAQWKLSSFEFKFDYTRFFPQYKDRID